MGGIEGVVCCRFQDGGIFNAELLIRVILVSKNVHALPRHTSNSDGRCQGKYDGAEPLCLFIVSIREGAMAGAQLRSVHLSAICFLALTTLP